MRLRKLKDGTLFAPKRGPAPDVPEGYERADYNPYVFIPVLNPCDYRIEEKLNCKQRADEVCRLYCDNIGEYVTKGICKDCEGTIDIRPQEIQASEDVRLDDELQFDEEDSESGSIWSGD